jgi:Tol biopolymer transport system component
MPSGHVKVLDFGLARGGGGTGTGSDPNLTHSPTLTHAATRAGVILGTAAYMSPEQARGRTLDRRTDIWSFGCVLYECLTGRPLYEGETVSDLIARILEREPDWAALPANTPVRVRELLKKCLRKDPKARLRDIGDARLELSEAFAPMAGSDASPSTIAPARSSKWPWIVAAAGVALAVASFVLRPAPTVEVANTMRVSVPLPRGLEVSLEVPDITISPDGRTIMFAAIDSSGTTRLYLRPLDAATARVLPGTEGAVIPFWAPDNRQIAFFAGGDLKRMALTDDQPQVICRVQSPRGGAWGPDNIIVFAPAGSGPLMQVPASGGTPAPATTLDEKNGEKAHRFPQFLPDGKHFLYVALPEKEGGLETRVATLDGTVGAPLLAATGRATYAAPGYLVFLRNESVLAQRFDASSLKLLDEPRVLRDLGDATNQYSGSPAVEVSRDGVLIQREVRARDTRITLLDRSGRTIRTLPLPTGRYSELEYSPDGTRLAFTHGRGSGVDDHVWVVDVARGVATRISFDSIFDTSPIWTPDGRRVVWGSHRQAGRNFYWRAADGTGTEELIADVPNIFNDPCSIVGNEMIYRSLSGETNEDIWVLPLTGERTPKPLIQTRFNEYDAALSPDGKWLAYRGDDSGRFEIYVVAYPSLEGKVRVSTAGAAPTSNTVVVGMRWRGDGREFYYIGGDARTMMVVPIEGGDTFRFDTPRPLFRIPRETMAVDCAPDGQSFAVSVPAQSESRSILNLVMNWEREVQTSK